MCMDCSLAIFVEGSWKHRCARHHQHYITKENEKEIWKLHVKGVFKRARFMKLAQMKRENVFVVPQCDIERGEYSVKFKNSILYYDSLGDDCKAFLASYNRESYIRLNYQQAILPSLVLDVEREFDAKPNCDIVGNKFDIVSAFITNFKDTTFRLPASERANVILVNEDANTYFHTLSQECKDFGIIKCYIVINRHFRLPYIPYRKDSKLYYTFCKICLDLRRDCNHNNTQRGFYVQCYLSDCLFMKYVLQYTITVTHIVTFASKHNQSLHEMANILLDIKNSGSALEKFYSKQLCLLSIGKFALNVSEFTATKINIITSKIDLDIQLENLSNIQSIAFQGNFCILHKKSKQTNYTKQIISKRNNTSNIVFGAASNRIRHEMFSVFMFLSSSSIFRESCLLRFDTDAFIVSMPTSHINVLLEFLQSRTFKYKHEMNDIIYLKNYSRQSHLIVRKHIAILKCPGLSLNILQRLAIMNKDFIKK